MTAQPTESQLDWFRSDVRRADENRYTDRVVVTVYQAKKMLAEIDALRAENEAVRFANVEGSQWVDCAKKDIERFQARVKWLEEWKDACEDTIARLNKKLLHPDVPAECHHLPTQAAWCETCKGRGEVGGLLPGDGGYQNDPCPDCQDPRSDERG